MAKSRKNNGLLTLFVLVVLARSMHAGAAGTATTNFSATIAYEGACEISVPPKVVFNNGNKVWPDDIESKRESASTQFNVTLSKCQGYGPSPQIAIDGESSNETGIALFLNKGETQTTGYGILLATEGNTYFKGNDNLAKNPIISASDTWKPETDLSAINGPLPITATLSCGQCSVPGRKGGKLKSNVTFVFKYE